MMDNSIGTIKESVLREFADAKAIDSIFVFGREGGYVITIHHGSYARTLVSSRGNFRLFTLDNAAKYLRGIGVERFQVDASGFTPGLIRSPRPDRAAALRSPETKHQPNSQRTHASPLDLY